MLVPTLKKLVVLVVLLGMLSIPSDAKNIGGVSTGTHVVPAGGAGTGDVTDVGDCSTGACFTADGTGTTLHFEGASADGFEQIVGTDDPTADRTFNFPDDEMAAGDVLVADAASSLVYVGLTNGQVLVGSTGATPVAASITGDDGITVTGGAGTIELDVTPLTTGADADSTTTSNDSFLEIVDNSLTLNRGCSDGQIPKWVEATDVWNCAADADSGGATAWDDIGDPDANGTIAFAAFEQIITMSQTTGDVSGLTLDFNQVDDAAATDDVIAFALDLTSESGDAGDTLKGMVLSYENGTANTILDAGIEIDNEETTASTMTDAIIVKSSGVSGGVVDAIDVSAANITNAINIGANNFITAAATLASTELDRLDGINAALADLNDSPVWTGGHDFGGASFVEVPNGTGPTTECDDPGEVCHDTTDNQLVVDDHVFVKEHTRCGYFEDIGGDDNIGLGTWGDAVTITSYGCAIEGTVTTAAILSLEDGAGNAMTGANTCAANTSAITYTAISAGGALTAGESLLFDTDTDAVPTTDDITVCVTYTFDRQ